MLFRSRAGNSYFGRYDETAGVEGSTWFDGKTIVAQDPDHVDPTDLSWAATIKAYTRCVVPARAGDAPGETDDGTAYLADLAATNATLFADTAGTFAASAGLVGGASMVMLPVTLPVSSPMTSTRAYSPMVSGIMSLTS